VVRTIVTSNEVYSQQAFRSKVKSPFEYVISALRATDATLDNPLPIARALNGIGEGLYLAQPPTGYSDAASVWINTGALISRLNFALSLAAGKLPGSHVDLVKLIPTGDPAERATEPIDRIRDRRAVALAANWVSAPPPFSAMSTVNLCTCAWPMKLIRLVPRRQAKVICASTS